ncbi:hypothetical protein [Caballeronia sp. AZ7_KS35]|uniref:hypothetical protein n=1 Tax=Caballeronia sp. AZ7_KS35 TaxID=2921762 RepID=UPI0032EED8C9
MTVDPVSLDILRDVQTRLHHDLPRNLTPEQRKFLISLVQLEYEWPLMGYDHLRDLPAIRWKIENLRKLRSRDPAGFAQQATLLQQGFDALS